MPSPFLGPMMLLIDEQSRQPVTHDAEAEPVVAPAPARQRRILRALTSREKANPGWGPPSSANTRPR